MIIRSLLRPQNVLQAARTWQVRHRPDRIDTDSHLTIPMLTLAQAGAALPCLRRLEHTMPLLVRDTEFSEGGVTGFMSPDGYKMAWRDYQSMLVIKLNDMTTGTVDESLTARELAIKYAHDSQNAALFNNASMAFNNHFFFHRLTSTPTEPSKSFMQDIAESFESMENLRTEMIETADAMFGNGFVWLMKDNAQGMLRVLATYNAGSPLPEAHYRRQNRDMNTLYQHIGADAVETNRLNTVQNTAGKFGHYSQPAGKALASTDALTGGPILCIGNWQHMYLRDYGVHGRRSYLSNWWDRIDWSMVEQSGRMYGRESKFPGMLGGRLQRSMNRPY